MKANKLSNDAIKALFNFADSLKTSIKIALADGKVNLTDIPAFLGVLLTLPPVINSIAKLPAEVIDLDPIEVDEIKARLREYSKDEAVINMVGYLLLALANAVAIAKKK